MSNKLDYPEIILPRLRYQFCPMCCESLSRKVMADDGIARVVCSSCGWIHYPTQAQGVNVIIWKELDSSMEGIVALLPPDAPKEAPAALPSGHVEYGESPEEAAIREAREETGLEVEVIRNLGWYYGRPLAYPGPMISFVYETRAIGGTLKESDEGAVEVFPLNLFPQISPNRTGSQQAMQLLHNSRLKCLSI